MHIIYGYILYFKCYQIDNKNNFLLLENIFILADVSLNVRKLWLKDIQSETFGKFS
jgi:hypothetical protein